MAHKPDPLRLIILANTRKTVVRKALKDLKPWLVKRARIVAEPDIGQLSAANVGDLPPADLALVLGGDGTMLAQARHLARLRIPLLGVNFGKIGFLAEFNLEDLKAYWPAVADQTCHRTPRLMMEALVFGAGAADCQFDHLDMDRCTFRSVALNDAVITAGEPFRMLQMGLAIEPDDHSGTTSVIGDGIIISTPTGSTAHSVAAGGPILSPEVEALCITPICVHSLAFRPLVVRPDAGILIRLESANAGTTLVIDGQETVKLHQHDQIYVRQGPHPLLLVRNPQITYWEMLARKMRWAAKPRNV